MALSPRIEARGGFTPTFAMAFGAMGGDARQVEPAAPLPVQPGFAPSTAIPLTGTASASGQFGPFVPEPGRPIWLTLSGTWSGTVTVLRSTDGGTTRLPLTLAGGAWGSFSANVQEVVGEESVAGSTWWLDVQRQSGTLAFEVRQ